MEKTSKKYFYAFISCFIILVFITLTQYFQNVETQIEMNRYKSHIDKREVFISQLKDMLGYGGAIQFFKNYLLRGEMKDFLAAEKSFFNAKQIIEEYKKIPNLKDKELKHLEIILETISAYYLGVLRAQSIKLKQNLTPTQIDQKLQIDDLSAVESLTWLRGNQKDLKEDAYQQLGNQFNKVLILLIIGFAFSVFAIFALGLRTLKYSHMNKQQDQRLLAISETSNSAIMAINDRGKVIYWNQSAESILGWKKEEIIGKDIKCIIPPQFQEPHTAGLKKAQRVGFGKIALAELSVIHKSGLEFPIEISISSWKETNHIYYTAFIRDISNRIKVKNELALQRQKSTQSAKLASLGEMAAGVGHEINNPLALGVGNLARIKKALIAESINHENLIAHIEKVEVANERIRNIVDGLRTYARSNNDNNEVISLKLAIDQTVNLISEIYEKDGISITRKNTPLELFIRGNLGKLQQIIMNLISNAKDATEHKKNRAICLSLEPYENNSVLFSVTDNGCGIPKNIKHKILDPFFTTKEVGKGTGMGLGVVCELVEEMKGSMQIDTQVGTGSTFSVIFPAVDAKLFKEVEPLNFIKKETISGTALVIDDEEGMRELLVECLEDLGLSVDEADDGDTGLEKVRQKKYDYICTDMKMKRMQGDEFIQAAKNLPLGDTKYFIITGGVSSNQLENNKKLANGYIKKPFTEDSIYLVLSKAAS